MQPLDQLVCYQISGGQFQTKKNMSYKRARLGVCPVQLKMNQQELLHKYLIAFGGQCGSKFSKMVEKYNIRANVWQTMPELNVARINASGFVLGNDNLYVFGGQFEPRPANALHANCLVIERLNLKNCHLMKKFELLEITMPPSLFQTPSLTEVGIYIPSSFEAIIFGGFSSLENQSKGTVFKFLSCQGTPETIEQEASGLSKEDFFVCQDAL